MVPTLLAASVGVPYLVTNPPDIDWSSLNSSALTDYFTKDSGKARATAPSSATLPGMPQVLPTLSPPASESPIFPITTPLEGNPTTSLAEVLRLDVSKDWVYGRWPRKSTGLADLNEFGIRVPLVSGTRITDLAGSLTYRFDANGHVERISFRGRTGDTTELVLLMVRKYQFQRQPTTTPGTQLYQVRRGNDIISELRTQPAAILWASSPNTSFDVALELQRPNGKPLPPKPLLPAPHEEKEAAATLPSQSSQAAADTKAGKEGADDEPAKPTPDPQQHWNNFFPRSRVSPEQLEYLKRSRM